MKIIATSDFHSNFNYSIPKADTIIIAGDITELGIEEEWDKASEFIQSLPHKYKLIIPGNHDFNIELLKLDNNSMLLVDQEVTIEGLKFYGCPWTRGDSCWAYSTRDKKVLREKYGKIPLDTNILISHMPPYGILDICVNTNQSEGSSALLSKINRLPNLRYHIFGHFHEASGEATIGNITFFNVSKTLREIKE